MSCEWEGLLRRVWSERGRALASHHSLLTADVDTVHRSTAANAAAERLDLRSLPSPPSAAGFAEAFAHQVDGAVVPEIDASAR